MKKTIAQNDDYVITYDPMKNRLYFDNLGFWNDVKIAEAFLADVQTALQHVQPGFTLLNDLRHSKIPARPVTERLKEVNDLLDEAQLRKFASLLPKTLIRSAEKRIMQEGIFEKAQFESPEEAEKWLDER